MRHTCALYPRQSVIYMNELALPCHSISIFTYSWVSRDYIGTPELIQCRCTYLDISIFGSTVSTFSLALVTDRSRAPSYWVLM
ncbi:hypothetical protein BJ165DRAFT_1502603 [Panaeolus papilionaceus]|nr:hypothetical protein BJ165DRAFT_1502603 [Panaeolus papilionaceus]